MIYEHFMNLLTKTMTILETKYKNLPDNPIGEEERRNLFSQYQACLMIQYIAYNIQYNDEFWKIDVHI